MNPIARNVFPVLVGLLLWCAAGSPVRAQQPSAGRYAFADTTLLRDTLDLKFDALFPLADSLRVTPDTLRAIAIRYETPIERLAFLADSMRMPVDSVGPVLERERYNPLNLSVERLTSFGYRSTYSITQQSTTWLNSSEYNIVRGPVVLRTVTTVSFVRVKQGLGTLLQRNRTSTTEGGWKFSPDFSVGTRVNLQGFDSDLPGSIYNRHTTTNQLQFSARGRQQPRPNLTNEMNFLAGPFDEPNTIPVKSGFGGQYDGRLEYASGNWMRFDVNSGATLRMGQAHVPKRRSFDVREYSGQAQGTLGLFATSPVSLLFNYQLNADHSERPDTTRVQLTSSSVLVDTLNREPSGTAEGDLSIQFKHGSAGTFTITGQGTRTKSLLSVSKSGRFIYQEQVSGGQSIDATARYQWTGWGLDATYSYGSPASDTWGVRPWVLTDASGSPVDTVQADVLTRSGSWSRKISADLSRNLTSTLLLKASGQVSLTAHRDWATLVSYNGRTLSATRTPSGALDDYFQSYRLEGTYSSGAGASNTLALEVQRSLTLNLTADQSASNTETRIYLADWQWTYRLLPGLTATQHNQINATYTKTIYRPDRNQLGLTYLTITTLNATVTPHLTMDITHNASYRPSGDYQRAPNGLDYFNLSNRNQDYMLSGRIAYTPIQAISINLQPTFQSTNADVTTAGQSLPSSRRRGLNVSGGANVNLPVAGKGKLSGGVSRTQESSRQIQYISGIAQPAFGARTSYWSGSLQFSWQL